MKVNKLVKKYITSDIDRALLVGLFFSLPFDNIPSIELYSITIKASAVLGLLVIIRTLYLLAKRRINLVNNFYYKILFVFVLWVILLVPESIVLSRAINYAVLTAYVALLAVCVSMIFKKEYIKPIVYVILVSACIASILGIAQYFGDYFGFSTRLTGLNDMYTKKTLGFTRINSFLLEPLYLASYMALPFLICVSMFFSKEKLINQKLLIFLILLFGLTVLLTLSRGGIVGVGLATALVIFIGLKNKVYDRRKIVFFIALVFLGIILSQLIINNFSHKASDYTKGKQGSGAYIQQLTDLTLSNGDERKLSRDNAFRIIGEDSRIWIFGVGPAQYGPHATEGKLVNGRWLVINNLPIAVLVELGLFGLVLLVAFVMLIKYSIVSSIKHYDLQIEKVFIIALAGYLVSQAISYQTYSTIYIMHVWACIGVMMALALNARKKSHNKL
jgi:hypothetical protein